LVLKKNGRSVKYYGKRSQWFIGIRVGTWLLSAITRLRCQMENPVLHHGSEGKFGKSLKK
jgi:hypothetical protein